MVLKGTSTCSAAAVAATAVVAGDLCCSWLSGVTGGRQRPVSLPRLHMWGGLPEGKAHRPGHEPQRPVLNLEPASQSREVEENFFEGRLLANLGSMPTSKVGGPVPTHARQGRKLQRYGEQGERLLAG